MAVSGMVDDVLLIGAVVASGAVDGVLSNGVVVDGETVDEVPLSGTAMWGINLLTRNYCQGHASIPC